MTTTAVLGLIAALSEGQRAIAHLLIVLGILAALAVIGAVELMRRRDRRPDESNEVGEEAAGEE